MCIRDSSSSVLYEMVGPVCAKMSLFLSGSITTEKMKEVAKEREDEIRCLLYTSRCV